MSAERLSRLLLILLCAEWLYISGYISILLLASFRPALEVHDGPLWAAPAGILLSTFCLLALIAIGVCTIVAWHRGAWKRVRRLLLAELALMVILPLAWGWLLYIIVESSFILVDAVTHRFWGTVRDRYLLLLPAAYPAVVLSKPALALATAYLKRPALSHN